ncbi:MAG TPA: hypothetical protein ENH99_02970 [Candidatus Pacearchaeota archaeon]|nr:hypothetical protein [Candidatus Pacearchaeota archaeon]
MDKYNLKRKGQEEMVGFAIIVIIVAVILLFFISFGLRGEKEAVDSFEVASFIQSFLQYTTECMDNLDNFSIQQLIFECDRESSCFDGRDSCEVLETTLEQISSESWIVSPGSPVKGYELEILFDGEEMLVIKEGNSTNNLKGSVQNFARSSDLVDVIFRVYS